MTPIYKTLHKDFKLNGLSCTWDDLKYLGYAFVKEGETYERSIGDFLLSWADESPTLQVSTSGSTGKPKRILLRKELMVNSAVATGNFFDLRAKDAALLCLSADNIAGKMMLVRAMILGLELDFMEPSSSPLALNSKNYDFCAMVPLQVQNSLERLDKIKTLIVGGAPISSSLDDRLQNTSCEVFETYGMTETITHVAARRISKTVGSSAVENFFTTFPDVTIGKDQRGCLVIEAPKRSDEPVITNDLVDLISETEFEWLGRYDNVINSGGVKLFPEQIEKKLTDLIPNRFFLAGLPHNELGQQLVLIVEGEVDKEALHQEIAKFSSLNKYEVPRKIRVIPKFLETDTGKIRRKDNVLLAQT